MTFFADKTSHFVPRSHLFFTAAHMIHTTLAPGFRKKPGPCVLIWSGTSSIRPFACASAEFDAFTMGGTEKWQEFQDGPQNEQQVLLWGHSVSNNDLQADSDWSLAFCY